VLGGLGEGVEPYQPPEVVFEPQFGILAAKHLLQLACRQRSINPTQRFDDLHLNRVQ
jgi:hypothetical protein